MILPNRPFEREPPSREAKSIYIFCEGAKREYQYFNYFSEIEHKIRVEVHKRPFGADHSPLGLLNIAQKCIIASEENPNPQYEFLENDEVWIVLDTDKDKDESRKSPIEQVRNTCRQEDNWFVAESNPCFEVWLYYHFLSDKPTFEGDESCSKWKELVNDSIKGGFDSRKHPICIENAQKNAEKNYQASEGIPNVGSTEVFKLSKNIFSLVETKIKQILASWEISCKEIE